MKSDTYTYQEIVQQQVIHEFVKAVQSLDPKEIENRLHYSVNSSGTGIKFILAATYFLNVCKADELLK